MLSFSLHRPHLPSKKNATFLFIERKKKEKKWRKEKYEVRNYYLMQLG